MNSSRETALTGLVWLALLTPCPVLAGSESGQMATPMPVILPTEDFREVLVSVGDDLFIAGQPTEQGLADMAADGVHTVINLRTEREMDDRQIVPFDEAALIAELGMRYVHIPSGGPETPYTPEMVDRFASALTATEGKVLLHCTVAWRASHLYTAWLVKYRGLSLPEAVAHGQAINLGQLPLEGFMGERLTIDVAPGN